MRYENKLWLTVRETSPILGMGTDEIYLNIRRNTFPFKFVRIGGRIRICARALGLITDSNQSQNSNAQDKADVYETVA